MGAAIELRNLARALPRETDDLRRTLGVEAATRRLLIGGVIPSWLGAGPADWYRHRRTRIETTAGPRESDQTYAEPRRRVHPRTVLERLAEADDPWFGLGRHRYGLSPLRKRMTQTSR